MNQGLAVPGGAGVLRGRVLDEEPSSLQYTVAECALEQASLTLAHAPQWAEPGKGSNQ